jgi:hypothetical protein
MSEKFRVAVFCVILCIFAFVLLGMSYGSLRGIFRNPVIGICFILWHFLPGLLSLISVLGLLRKKIWSKWMSLAVCIYVLYRGVRHNFRIFLVYGGFSVQKEVFGSFGGQNPIIGWLLSPMFWIPTLGIIGIVLALSTSRKYFCNSR